MRALLSQDDYHNLFGYEHGTPFYTPRALDFLSETVRPEMRVFEFGGGASTVWYAERVAQVATVEHDPRWVNRIKKVAEQAGVLVKVDLQVKNRPYHKAILKFPPEFDLVIVDGRDRCKCVVTGMTKVKPGGFLVLDNAERLQRYASALTRLSRWEAHQFDDWAGEGRKKKRTPRLWRTTFYRRT